MSHDPLRTFREAHARDYVLREIAFEQTLRAAAETRLVLDAAITGLDATALQAWRSSWSNRQHGTGHGAFAWDLLSRRYRQKPRGFHAAIWNNGQLCGLAAGWLSPGKQQLTLHYLESAPDAHHPQRGDIAYPAFTAAEFYGTAVGARALLLGNPLPGIAQRYEGMGFTLAFRRHGLRYYQRPIT